MPPLSSPLPMDTNNNAIQAASVVQDVLNVTLNSSTYMPVTLPSTDGCKSISAKSRNGVAWYLATSASPTDYMTVTGTLSLDLVATGGMTLFYAKGSEADVLEVLLLN